MGEAGKAKRTLTTVLILLAGFLVALVPAWLFMAMYFFVGLESEIVRVLTIFLFTGQLLLLILYSLFARTVLS